MNQKIISVKTITLISILISLGVIFSYVDKLISTAAFPFLPTAKIGLANIVIVIGLFRFTFKESLIMVILKSILVGLLFGSITAFVIGGTASLISFFVMYLVKNIMQEHGTMVSVSVVGGFFHIITQLIVVAFIYRLGTVVLFYGAMLIFVSLVSSILIGLIANKLQIYVNKEKVR